MITKPFYILDVFTDQQFGGNQLAVIPDAEGIPENKLQAVAREFNFSETTFVYPPVNPKNDFKVRIFTPGNEMPTAGHPTIGTAYTMLNLERVKTKKRGLLIFEQKVGEIPVTYSESEDTFVSLTMSQPLPVFGPVLENNELIAKILSLKPERISDKSPVQSVSCGNNFLFIPLKSIEDIRQIKVRPDKLEEYSTELDSTELYVFSGETINPAHHIHGRMFAPMFGITEDPATGSASGPLGCYLVKHGLSDGSGIICEQGFEMGRPSIVNVQINSSADTITEVLVSGECVLIAKGEIAIQ